MLNGKPRDGAHPHFPFNIEFWKKINSSLLICNINEEQSGGTVDWPFMLCILLYLEGKAGRIFTTWNEKCIYMYISSCQPKWPSRVCNLEFFCQSTVPPLHSSLILFINRFCDWSQDKVEFILASTDFVTLLSKLYIPSTLNIALLQWHTHLNVCAVK